MTAAIPYDGHVLLIDGDWVTPGERETLDVVNPATGGSVGALPRATPEDVDRALAAAARAFPVWRATRGDERARILRGAAERLRDRSAEIAPQMVLEQGKPIGQARGEVQFAADILDFMAGEAARVATPVEAAEGPGVSVVSEPVGVVAAFTPWNYPAIVPARKLGAALAAGCTVVIKPAEEAPSSAVAVARALVDAGLPAGAVNVLFGDPPAIADRLISSPVSRMVALTGSTIVGRRLAATAAAHLKPCTFELGGHAPVLVFDDVDIDEAAQAAVANKFDSNAQSCGSGCRYYVQEGIYDEFVERFAALAASLSVGDPMDEATDVGPLIGPYRLTAMDGLVADAVSRGARVVTGGEAIPGKGNYFRPTVLADVPGDALVMNEEPFGPLASFAPFRTEEEAVALANSTSYGLAAYVLTGDPERAARLPGLIDSGMVSVNAFHLGGAETFFGGTRESGYGSDGGPQAVEQFLRPKLVSRA